jgi:hypothetical protein
MVMRSCDTNQLVLSTPTAHDLFVRVTDFSIPQPEATTISVLTEIEKARLHPFRKLFLDFDNPPEGFLPETLRGFLDPGLDAISNLRINLDHFSQVDCCVIEHGSILAVLLAKVKQPTHFHRGRPEQWRR